MARIENRRVLFRSGHRNEHPIDLTLMSDNCKVVSTNGTTAVNVFGANGAPYNMTVTGCFVISKDTTAGNITPKVGSSTIATIAKGTSAGALVGATSLTTSAIPQGSAVTVVSSSAGDAQVFLFYTRDATN